MDVIVEFRAGRMALVENRLVADPRKGLLRVCQDEVGLSHFCWYERDAAGAAAGEAEQDIVIIPGECTFSKIARPGSRVFELRFPEEKQRNLFFWAQEVAAEDDDEYVAAINLALNMDVDGGEDGGEGMQADAAPPAAVGAPAQPGGVAPSPAAAITSSQLAAALGSILAGSAGQQGAAGTHQQQMQQAAAAAANRGPSLADVLNPELLAPLLQSPDMVQRLAPYLPEQHRTAAAIREIVSAPQFRHQLGLFSNALSTGQLDTSQFGLPAGGFGVLDFLSSIQAQADQQKQQADGGAADMQE
ncbi:26S proteasome regulatory subunit RPN13 [Chlorella vulgaris]